MEEKENLLMKIDETITWRYSMSRKFPDDQRNLRAVDQLKRIYDYVNTLPNHHILFSYWELRKEQIDDVILIERTDDITAGLLRVAGFSWYPVEPSEWVAELTKEIYETSSQGDDFQLN